MLNKERDPGTISSVLKGFSKMVGETEDGYRKIEESLFRWANQTNDCQRTLRFAIAYGAGLTIDIAANGMFLMQYKTKELAENTQRKN